MKNNDQKSFAESVQKAPLPDEVKLILLFLYRNSSKSMQVVAILAMLAGGIVLTTDKTQPRRPAPIAIVPTKTLPAQSAPVIAETPTPEAPPFTPCTNDTLIARKGEIIPGKAFEGTAFFIDPKDPTGPLVPESGKFQPVTVILDDPQGYPSQMTALMRQNPNFPPNALQTGVVMLACASGYSLNPHAKEPVDPTQGVLYFMGLGTIETPTPAQIV